MIEIQGLKFSYPGSEIETLHGLNFEIPKGEIFSFLGPSGAGKSTTLKILIGILKNYSGSVRVGGRELSQVSRNYYEKIGVSFEFPNLYLKLTAAENLKFFASLYRNADPNMEEILDSVGLFPDKDKRVEDFSKGMKMRLNFCRALINDPEVLFLDEPVSGLDPANARGVKDIILNLKAQGKTVFLTTHNMTIADELSDRVAFIVDGKIPLIDSPHNLKVKRSKRSVDVEFEDGMKSFPMDGLGENQEFLQVIKAKRILSIHSAEASLDDIFIEVTGKSLSDGEER